MEDLPEKMKILYAETKINAAKQTNFLKTQPLFKNLIIKKDLHDPDNHDAVITHLEPDILECEAKWVLGSIITSKASGGNGIPPELY